MEWIKYHEAEKVFDLRTEHSTYQMQVREYDTLVHLYYGSPVGDALITDRIVCVDRGFSGNPYEAEKDRTFSLDTLPQEYTAYGNGDYRINGLETEQADGSDTANLKFESYEITKGKYSLKGLPAMFAKEDEAAISDACKTVEVSIAYENGEQQVLLNGENVSKEIRKEEVGKMASATSVYKEVRTKLVELQQKLAADKDVIMDGRDIGTCVLPNAQVKIYLTASVETRAERRYQELQEKGAACDLEVIKKDIADRDYQDMHREISPLKQAEDAILVDSSDMGIEEVVETIKNIYREKC